VSWQGRRPTDPKIPITNRTVVRFWLLYAVVLFLAALAPLVVGPTSRARTGRALR
jgi:Ca2+-transporting ATPase